MKIRKIIIVVALLLFAGNSFAQQPPFYHDIQHFKKLDSAHFPEKNAILFVGSSSFTKWTDIQEYFPGFPIINRGFGGSSLPDVIRYASDIIYPYAPKQVIIYCGDNDFAYSDTVSAQTVVYRVQLLFNIIREILPHVPIDYVSIKYSPSRKKFWPKIKSANAAIERFFKSQKDAAFIDITKPMSTKTSVVDSTLFLQDRLHMKPAGYQIWQKAIEPYLVK